MKDTRLPTTPTSPNATELRTRSNPSRRAEAMAAGSKVTVDNLHLFPTQSTHPFGHVILKTLAFLILPYLLLAGLSQVDDGFASQVLRFDLWIVQRLRHQ